MKVVYHGSSVSKQDIIKRRKSIHGEYVYATNNKIIAILTSHECESEFTYSLGRDSKNEPYHLIERIPGAFDIMYKSSAFIYTLDGSNFKSVNTSLSQVISSEEEPVLGEEKIENLLKVIKNLEKENAVKVYRHPSKPEGFVRDNSDLIEKLAVGQDFETIRSRYITLLSYYPELLDKVNDKLFSINKSFPGFDTNDLFNIIDYCIARYNQDPHSEPFLKLKLDKFIKLYPIYFKDINLVDICNKKQFN